MKKLLLLGVVAISATLVNAQTLTTKIFPQDQNVQLRAQDAQKVKNMMNKRATSLSEQYNFVGAYGEEWMSGDAKSYVRWISEDSNAYTVYKNADGTTSLNNNDIHVIGTAFDPKDSIFLSSGNTVLSRWNDYTIDTIRWQQFYVRNSDSAMIGGNMVEVIDTLFVQYFDFTGLSFRAFTRNGTNRNAAPNVDAFKARSMFNTAALKTDTIFLDKSYKDSVDWEAGSLFSRVAGVLPGIKSKSSVAATGTTDVPANVTAYTLMFKPMLKPKLGDTLINWADPNWKRTYNAFGIRANYWDAQSQDILTLNKINNTFWTPNFLANGQTFNGWKSYLPTTAYNTTTFLNCWIDITTENLSNEKLVNGIQNTRVFPNPTAGQSSVKAMFHLNNSSTVSAVVMDINGRVVKNIEAIQFGAGKNQINIEVADMKAGIYTVSLQSAVGTETAKFIVQ
jgi:hypothetical protein